MTILIKFHVFILFIRDLILAPIEENWEKWFHFNLNRCEDQINFLMHKIENYKKLVR